jgi:WD40 repeat protein
VGQRDGRLSVYDARTGNEELAPMDVDVFPLGLGFLVWSTDGSRLFTGGQDGTLRAFETSTWKRMWEQVLAPDQSALRLGHLLEDEVTLIVPVESGEVFLVNSVDGNVQGEPFSAAGTQLQNAVMADHGRKLVAMSRDGKLRIWDVATHRQLGTALNGHVLVSIALDKIDEEHVISGGGVDGRIITWDLSGDNIVDRACALAGRNLTRSEWLRYVGGEYHVTCPEFPVGP